MAGPWHGVTRRWIAAAACAASCVALLAGSGESVAGLYAPVRVLQDTPLPVQALKPLKTLEILQMNLCNSGYASCFTGRSVAQAAEAIRAAAPDLVTLNEVCRNDLATLRQALTQAHAAGTIISSFKAAGDRLTAGAYHCRNGQAYGIGLLAFIATPNQGYTTDGDLYPTQEVGDPEERAWLCVYVTDLFSVCTTHLASTVPAVTLAQCDYLLHVILPAVRSRRGNLPVVLGGDLNVRRDTVPDAHSCLPSGYPYADDRGTQYIVTTTSRLGPARLIDMRGATDHPGILVTASVS